MGGRASPLRTRASPERKKKPMNSSQWWRASATDTAQAIARREVSAREVVQSCLDRIAQVNPALNALVDVRPDEALRAADVADAAVARGDALGPLHGVPVTVKVNVDQMGYATTNGVLAYQDLVAKEDSPVVANLRKAGAVFVGRNNTPAFSFRWFTDNDVHGQTLNPYDATRTPGGSSGGAAVAVATGMGSIAHGNDQGGSIRYPAYACGVYGLRPSLGRVPAFNPSLAAERTPFIQLSSVQGPLARSIDDLRLALEVMSAGDARDPWWVPVDDRRAVGASTRRRVALFTGADGYQADPVNLAALRRAASYLEDAGYEVEELVPPDFEAITRLWLDLSMAEVEMGMRAAVRQHGDPRIRHVIDGMAEAATPLDLAGYAGALSQRSLYLRRWTQFFERFDVLLMPVSWQRPFLLDGDRAPGSIAGILQAQSTVMPAAVLGLPGLSVPLGVVDGLPYGVQLMGGRFQEPKLLAAGAVLEARTGLLAPVDPR
jgi:amidase